MEHLDALLEIGCEELPADYISPALRQMQTLAEAKLKEARMAYERVETEATPRRLVLFVRGLAREQARQEKVVQGPTTAVAYRPDGTLTPAGEGFLRKVGLRADQVEVKDDRLLARVEESSRSAQELLPGLFQELIKNLTFPKSMRWEPSGARFARPVRWLVALFGSEIVPVVFAGVTAGRKTRLHPLHTPLTAEVSDVAAYPGVLERGQVMLPVSVRRERLHASLEQEAARLGAKSMTLIDVQKPMSFGKEREEAEKAGAKFLWPCFTKEITAEGVLLTDGRVIPGDTVIISIGDTPDLEAFPENIARERGFITVNDVNQTTDPRVFAIGDLVKLGLLTQAIGDGRRAAQTIDEIISGRRPLSVTADMHEELKTRIEYMDPGNHMSETIDYSRMNLAYFDPRLGHFDSLDQCAEECSSCGVCRDCGICEAICPRGAISREALPDNEFAMVCDSEKCIGCGFCAGACPCGIWTLIPNTPLE